MNNGFSGIKVNWEQACNDVSQSEEKLRKKFNRRALMGEIAMLVFIAVGFVLIHQRNMWHMPLFTIFTAVSCVYLLNRYVFHPICFNHYNPDSQVMFRKAKYIPDTLHLQSFMGCVEMLSSACTRVSGALGDENVTYRFYSLFYLPLIPVACYSDPTPSCDSEGDKYVWANKCEWRVWEVIYIYLRNWSSFIIVALASMMVLLQSL